LGSGDCAIGLALAQVTPYGTGEDAQQDDIIWEIDAKIDIERSHMRPHKSEEVCHFMAFSEVLGTC
jgi:hypothetical protein